MTAELHPGWLREATVERLLAAADAESVRLRFVGGCVRNALLGREETDLDLATPTPAEQVMERLGRHGIKVVPTGLAHGTVTAVAGGRPFEITTLRRDVETDGRHAKIAYTDNWEEDAARRDFTMNALYLTPGGELFDYFGGVADAEAGRVRFIGDPDKRIREDGLRILRFFRFHAQFGKGALDSGGFTACARHIGMLDSLSGERIQAEMVKLLRTADPLPVLSMMEEAGVWGRLVPAAFSPGALMRLVEVETLSGVKPCTKLRMAALLKESGDAAFLKTRWKCSKDLSDAVQALLAAPTLPAADEAAVKRLVRISGARMAVKYILWQWMKDDAAEPDSYRRALALARQWQAPQFPVTGGDLQLLGIPESKGLGDTLRKLETAWEKSDYTLTREELLALL